MDPKDHDDLRQNDLEQFLFGLKEFWGKHGMKFLVTILVVLAVLVGLRMIEDRRRQAREEPWRDLASTTSPEGLRRVAQSQEDPVVRAQALLRGADLLLHQSLVVEEGSESENPDAPGQTLEEAALMYENVLSIENLHEVFALNARLGLASVAESQEQWGKAAELLQSVAAGARDYPSIERQALGRLAMLDRLAEPVLFAPDRDPEEATERRSDEATEGSRDAGDEATEGGDAQGP